MTSSHAFSELDATLLYSERLIGAVMNRLDEVDPDLKMTIYGIAVSQKLQHVQNALDMAREFMNLVRNCVSLAATLPDSHSDKQVAKTLMTAAVAALRDLQGEARPKPDLDHKRTLADVKAKLDEIAARASRAAKPDSEADSCDCEMCADEPKMNLPRELRGFIDTLRRAGFEVSVITPDQLRD